MVLPRHPAPRKDFSQLSGSRLLIRGKARRIAANIVKLAGLVGKPTPAKLTVPPGPGDLTRFIGKAVRLPLARRPNAL
jgi:hypothetical protein